MVNTRIKAQNGPRCESTLNAFGCYYYVLSIAEFELPQSLTCASVSLRMYTDLVLKYLCVGLLFHEHHRRRKLTG